MYFVLICISACDRAAPLRDAGGGGQDGSRLPGVGDMRIVINALQYKPRSSGIGVMIRELFGAFCRGTDMECEVVMTRDSPEFPAGSGTRLIRTDFDHGEGIKRTLFQALYMGPKYCRDAILLTTDSKTPFFLPKSCRLVPLVTDLAVFRMPEVYKRSRVLLWRLQYKYVCRRAEIFLAVSEFTKGEMVKILGIPAEKIHVIPMACSESMERVTDGKVLSELRERYGLPERYILFVGNNNPRKNLERMIKAFDLMKERADLPHKLVIAGEQGWKFDREAALKNIKHRDDIIFTGFVPDEDMPALYTAAEIFVFATLYEGFGIPIIEAQKCGTPVVAADVASMPEVAGEGAELIDPYDIDSICAGMAKVLTDKAYAARLVALGYENEKRFSWTRSAELLRGSVEEMEAWIS